MRSAHRRELNRAARPCPERTGVKRVAMLSMHTSPLEQPGRGDAGGMNVYVMQTARHLAACNIEVEIFTRATSSEQSPTLTVQPGVTVHHVPAGPFDGLSKNDLPSQMCAFTSGVLRTEAANPAGYFDVVHSHYWLSGQAGWLAKDRWKVPLVHSAHTLAKVKNLNLAAHDTPEPFARIVGEEQIVNEADALVANTAAEAGELVEHYQADPSRVSVAAPGVDTEVFAPGDRGAARRRLGLPADAIVVGFVGRLQALKAPDVMVNAVARLRQLNPELADRIRMVIVGGQSGTGKDYPRLLRQLTRDRGLTDAVRFIPPRSGDELADVFRACDTVCVPSHNETFGLVALESQACGTPVVATAVGGLTTAVADGTTGFLVPGHDETAWAITLNRLLTDPAKRELMATAAVEHASRFSWCHTTANLVKTYRDALARLHANRAVAGAG